MSLDGITKIEKIGPRNYAVYLLDEYGNWQRIIPIMDANGLSMAMAFETEYDARKWVDTNYGVRSWCEFAV